MATGVEALESIEEGSRVVSEDGSGVVKKIMKKARGHVCRVLLDDGGEFEYDLETLGAEMDVNRTCMAFGICDGTVIGERRRPDQPYSEPICDQHNRLADEANWPGELQQYRDPFKEPPSSGA